MFDLPNLAGDRSAMVAALWIWVKLILVPKLGDTKSVICMGKYNRRKFRSQTSRPIWTDEKQSRAEAERRGRISREKIRREKSKKKEDADARKGRKVAKHCVFPMILGAPEGRKVCSLKRRVRSQLAR